MYKKTRFLTVVYAYLKLNTLRCRVLDYTLVNLEDMLPIYGDDSVDILVELRVQAFD